MTVRGSRETARALRDLANYVAVPLNAASRFALQPTVKAAKAKVQAIAFEDSTGALAASLTIRKKPRSSKLNPVHQVGPDSGFRKEGRRPVSYAHLVEFGTAPHVQPKRGIVHPGTRPMPFMEPAYHATKEEVVKRFGQRMGPEMEKRAAKVRARVK
jgi:HK97 gp10 family phage protein